MAPAWHRSAPPSPTLLGMERPPVAVIGGGLTGMAAAARLAKLGHRVELYEKAAALGGAWAPHQLLDGVLVDDAPAVFSFPAPWRDLFRKSGRPLEAELARLGYALVPADPPRLIFADGFDLILPTDRGEQYVTMRLAYGSGVAGRWRDLLDRLDDVWQAMRPLGLESELPARPRLTRRLRQRLLHRRTLADLAADLAHPHLRPLATPADQRRRGNRLGPFVGAGGGVGGAAPTTEGRRPDCHAGDRHRGRRRSGGGDPHCERKACSGRRDLYRRSLADRRRPASPKRGQSDAADRPPAATRGRARDLALSDRRPHRRCQRDRGAHCPWRPDCYLPTPGRETIGPDGPRLRFDRRPLIGRCHLAGLPKLPSPTTGDHRDRWTVRGRTVLGCGRCPIRCCLVQRLGGLSLPELSILRCSSP